MNDFIDEIDRFMALTGMKETTFGLAAMNDGKFVKKLREGRRCWPETMGRVRTYMKLAAKDHRATQKKVHA